MPLSDYSLYHGSVLSHIVEKSSRAISIAKMPSDVQGFYLLENKIPLYVKFSRKRKGPWSFTFQRDHQIQYQNFVATYGQCITAFACGTDGVAAVNHQQLRQILDDHFEEQESVAVKRRRGEMYLIKGRDGTLERKVSQDSLSDLVRDLIPIVAEQRVTL